MKTLFIVPGPIQWGSCRMRAYWVAPYMEDAQVMTVQEYARATDKPQADVYILLKQAASAELVQSLKDAGKMVVWDLCDPVHWFSPKEARDIAGRVDVFSFSSVALMEDFKQWHDCAGGKYVCIHDAIEPAHFPIKRLHQSVETLRFIWFGMAQNRIALHQAVANLMRLTANGLQFSLTIFDDRPDSALFYNPPFPIHYEGWSLEHENEVIAGHDVALLPPYPGPWGDVKSNNKYWTAKACGLPVMDGYNYEMLYSMFISHQYRESCAQSLTLDDQHPRLAAKRWEELLCAS